MSISLNLVIYQHENGKFSEENLKTVRCEEVSESLLEQILKTNKMQTTKVYFDDSFDESFDIEYFDNQDIETILSELKDLFTNLISHEYSELIDKENISSEKNSNLKNFIVDSTVGDSHQNPTELAIARFRILTGVIGMFMDKHNKFSDETGAIIKLG